MVQGNIHNTIQTSLTSLQKNLLYHVLSVQFLVKQAFTFCDNPKPDILFSAPNLGGSIAIGTI